MEYKKILRIDLGKQNFKINEIKEQIKHILL